MLFAVFLLSVLTLLLVLDPRYKLEYFRDANWVDDWVSTSEEVVRTIFEARYLPTVEGNESNDKVCATLTTLYLYSP